MTKNSITKRIKITRSGKVCRRAMGLGHSKTNKTKKERARKKGNRGLNLNAKNFNKNLKN